ncbi:hypothetical protein A2954_04910 [Candidatus Roizmanbacteria bacterium RIFCSPLOWO2_01_FULL_37_12]|uniref:Uncharacterized protein n=1 Tax=Candidatus Roizmanbacteria bacterium RIFCSPLOWO2_01_FULL_37_12 TaxID=1802056 RepID=A0A1F7I8N0_9BACT|nr:MAG: hypothetical protein A2768_02000 [Candidatus Roizmanbacteria bacterium RIFCSPHIGHO2_01_FULL_37_16]OGK23699.1 MAG: hypothetical protein A3D76_03950 [Candidatus Roizmanbacteria bacterium RIFCSPHIGHO2_02_FULL_37_9b]OGK39737.1 MAG: hypothetical protein A2954_04910 [Candidatus Roizmanbacteria bacterium RIFCSPLOWO2_01_FULL_37_12]
MLDSVIMDLQRSLPSQFINTQQLREPIGLYDQISEISFGQRKFPVMLKGVGLPDITVGQSGNIKKGALSEYTEATNIVGFDSDNHNLNVVSITSGISQIRGIKPTDFDPSGRVPPKAVLKEISYKLIPWADKPVKLLIRTDDKNNVKYEIIGVSIEGNDSETKPQTLIVGDTIPTPTAGKKEGVITGFALELGLDNQVHLSALVNADHLDPKFLYDLQEIAGAKLENSQVKTVPH